MNEQNEWMNRRTKQTELHIHMATLTADQKSTQSLVSMYSAKEVDRASTSGRHQHQQAVDKAAVPIWQDDKGLSGQRLHLVCSVLFPLHQL